MNFLEAHRLVSEFSGGPERPILFALSGTGEPFRVYLEAAGAKRGLAVRPRFLPFNTLGQHLALDSVTPTEPEVLLLLPWDFVPETDWRSGVPPGRVDVGAALERAEETADRLQRRPGARLLYLPAELPPVVGYAGGDRVLKHALDHLAVRLGATPLPAEAFSLGAYFASGCPVGGAWLGKVAELGVGLATVDGVATHKALITDLDDTLWAGIIAEDGVANIAFGPEGRGYRHYVYQTFLARLRREGVVLAAVTRNDPEVVQPPFRSGRMPLGETDLVAICASYHAKSAQVRQLATQLNLGLDAFVFVDDNPVELEEVHQALPEVQAVAFPDRDEDLPRFLEQLTQLFGRRDLTQEDRERTDMYRRRLEGLPPAEVAGADLTGFLASLQMRLVVHDRSRGDRTRAVQLINKTNQFNANGRRWTDGEVAAVLERGGKLLAASLADRSGSHGEILACLIEADGVIEAFVMSCRVFQRRVEEAFLAAMAGRGIAPGGIRFAPTERNEPFRQFVLDAAFGHPHNGVVPLDAAAFHTRHRDALDLFTVTWD
jgi:FkbH-like protein